MIKPWLIWTAGFLSCPLPAPAAGRRRTKIGGSA